MFQKILIANRGEIACRIIKTARRMGIATVAIYSEADRQALHVAMADEAICVGPPSAARSYLDIEPIVGACRTTGADAVHPGYGFLSERAAFAMAVAAAGITFIGPHPAAIEAMGDKIRSKEIAAQAGVPVIPGHQGAIQDIDEAQEIAASIGYPVMIKASAGGGGKGMRIAAAAEQVAEAFARARSEASASFGDDRLLIEKFIERPRHIEFQVLADKHGTVVHLGERECSIQRRNQKVVEEAPSPFLDEAMRRDMGVKAVALARAVTYDSAGTVEFVVGQDRRFYFLEMNTRLQVEHPVTELVTGIDLVEQMILAAAGEPLDLVQDRIASRGWAIETRINAEDATRGFVPSTGRLVRFEPPPTGRHGERIVRVDSGVVAGGSISAHYDSMIAKLITLAPDRAGAIAEQADALDRFVIEGIRHNVPFLASLMRSQRWRDGLLSTRFLDEEYPHGFRDEAPKGAMERVFVTVAIAIDVALQRRRTALAGEARALPYEGRRVVLLGAQRHDVEVVVGELIALYFVDGDAPVEIVPGWLPGERVWTGTIDGQPVAFGARAERNGYRLSHGGCVAEARVYTSRQADLAALMIDRQEPRRAEVLLCPMPGLVKAIHVAEGDTVAAGQPLCRIEAMKMETEIAAEHDGAIASIEARVGDTLAVDSPIMTFA